MKDLVTQAALATIVQMDLAISERLANDPQALALFDAYNNLFDSLYLGLRHSPPDNHERFVHQRLKLAEETLARLGVMGRALPDTHTPQ